MGCQELEEQRPSYWKSIPGQNYTHTHTHKVLGEMSATRIRELYSKLAGIGDRTTRWTLSPVRSPENIDQFYQQTLQ